MEPLLLYWLDRLNKAIKSIINMLDRVDVLNLTISNILEIFNLENI